MKIIRIVLPEEEYKDENFVIFSENSNVLVDKICFSDCEPATTVCDDNYRMNYGFPLSPYEIQNYNAHIKAWKIFRDSNEQWAMIIESNVDLSVDIETLYSQLNDLPSNAELFFPYDIFSLIKNKKNEKWKQIKNPNTNEIRNFEAYMLGCKHGNSIYFINKKGVEKMLNINIISDRLDHDIIRLSIDDKLEVYYNDSSWFNINNINQEDWSDRIDLIWNTINNNSFWDAKSQRLAKNMLSLISSYASELGIKLILQGGTHLGYVQHSGIMNWDDDIDLGIEEERVDEFINHIKNNSSIRLEKKKEFPTSTEYYKLWDDSGYDIDGYNYKFPFIDLWLYKRNGSDLVFKNGIICHDSAKEPFVEVCFEGSRFYVTYNSLDILDNRYANWREKILVYPWSHRYEKKISPALSVPIIVDDYGKMIKLSR